MKVATKLPSTNWVPRSRMKLRSRRGPNCEVASCRVTTVSEKVRPVTVIIEPAIVARMVRAPSGPNR